VRHELLNFLDHTSSPTVFSGFRVARFLIFCVVFCRLLFVLLAQQISETIVHIVVQAPKLTWRLLRDNLFGKPR